MASSVLQLLLILNSLLSLDAEENSQILKGSNFAQQKLSKNDKDLIYIDEMEMNEMKSKICTGLSVVNTGISTAAFWYPPAWIPGIIGNIAHFGLCTVSNEEATTMDYALDGVGIVSNMVSPMAPFSKIIVDEAVNFGSNVIKLGRHLNKDNQNDKSSNDEPLSDHIIKEL